MTEGALPRALHARMVEGLGGSLDHVRPLAGGDTSAVVCVERGGQRLCLKWSAAAAPGFFAAEAAGLRRLASTQAMRVPAPLEVAEADGDCPAFLLMEYIEPPRGRLDRDAQGRRLGEALASLHQATGGGFGLEEDNFISVLPQRNAPRASWGAFWWEQRIGAQLEIARERRALRPKLLEAMEALCARGAGLLPEAPPASLLHGDLWSGNILFEAGGAPVLIDPAVYYGDREVDLAMAALFGGFPASFWEAYAATWPLEPGYAERRALYQAYPLLVHANLFGGRYPKDLASTLAPWLP